MVNVFDPSWEHVSEAPFLLRAARVGAQAGSARLGASLYELGPGAAASPYHAHHSNEELLVVLSGRPMLRAPGGERQLARGEVVAFPAGPDGTHRVENHDPEPARVLILSTMRFPDLVEHPDSGRLLALFGASLGGGQLLAFRLADAVDLSAGDPAQDS